MFRIKLQFWDWDFWDWAIQNPSFVVGVEYSLLVSIALIIVSGSCNIIVWFRVGLLSLPLSYKQSICACSKLIILVVCFLLSHLSGVTMSCCSAPSRFKVSLQFSCVYVKPGNILIFSSFYLLIVAFPDFIVFC